MICNECNHNNPSKSKYCNNCGALLDKNSKDKYMKIKDQNENIDEYIYDRKKYKSKSKSKSKGFLLRLVLILTLAIVFLGSFYIVEIANDSNKEKILQKEIEIEREKEREKEMEALKALEDYTGKFDALLAAFIYQKDLIDESLNSMGDLKFNKFGKKLNFGEGFNNFINKMFDNSSVKALASESETIDILMKEVENPPESFEKKHKNLKKLHSIEKNIKDELYPEVSKNAKENVTNLLEEYKIILYALKEN